MPVLTAEMVPMVVKMGGSCRVNIEIAPKFKVGDFIIVRNLNPTGHTRLPRYVRSKKGQIAQDHGVFLFPDTNAHGLGHNPQHVYSVRFSARDLWGPEASARDSLYIDLFDDYLDLMDPV